MAITSVQEFLTKVGQDEALQAELATALEAGNERQAVTELAHSKGYEFSPEELMAEVEKRQTAAKEAAGELGDAELEEVAGGLTPTVIPVIGIATAGGASVGIGVSVNKKPW